MGCHSETEKKGRAWSRVVSHFLHWQWPTTVVPSDWPKSSSEWTPRIHPQCFHGYMAWLIPQLVGTRNSFPHSATCRNKEYAIPKMVRNMTVKIRKTSGTYFAWLCAMVFIHDGCLPAVLSISDHPSRTTHFCFCSTLICNCIHAGWKHGYWSVLVSRFCFRLFDNHARESTRKLDLLTLVSVCQLNVITCTITHTIVSVSFDVIWSALGYLGQFGPIYALFPNSV